MAFTPVGPMLQILTGSSIRNTRLARCDCGRELLVFCTPGGAPIPVACYWCDTTPLPDRGVEKLDPLRRATHKAWEAMLDRCFRPEHPFYKRYGARGISVCARWQRPWGYENFAFDIGIKPHPGLWLERIDNDGNYACGHCDDCVSRGILQTNCCWASPKQQGRNRSNNRFVTVNSERRHLAGWADELVTDRITVSARLRTGWSEEDAVTIPVRRKLGKIDVNGELMTLAEWAKHLGTTTNVLRNRLFRGMTPEEAITTPILPPGGSRYRGAKLSSH